MSTTITLDEYFGPYSKSPYATDAVRKNAAALLVKVNELYAMAAKDGCPLPDNPATKSGVSGGGNGGFRPQDSTVGASNSRHKDGQAVDRYDPNRRFASWCMAHLDQLDRLGLYMEDPRWTPTWVHLQSVPPGSGKVVFVPSATPPICTAPLRWSIA